MKKTQGNSLLIGIHAIDSALKKYPQQIQRIVLAEEGGNRRALELAERAGAKGIRVEKQPRAALDRLSEGERHQDIVAEYAPQNLHGEKDLDRLLENMAEPRLVLVLDGVQDPHNLGACLRTADAAGVGLVIIPRDGAAGLTPVARRAASGAAEVMPLLFATNLARVLRRLKEQGIWLAGTTDAAERTIYEQDLTGPLALVMGGEGKGMRRLTSELCDYRVRIPMEGTVSSLNVSVATAISLYEINRQRGSR